ncbi:MAG: twin-arginine translocation signal domain-containing protein [Gemmatimonadales bacterium]
MQPSHDRREFLTRLSGAIAGVAATGLSMPSPARANGGRAGQVSTVLGPIDADRLGVTLPHEHVVASSAGFLRVWPEYLGAGFVDKAVAKLAEAKREGIDTIVDVTPIDVGRDVRLLAEVSRRSGMQIVCCTGHWLQPSLSMAARSVEELTAFFRREIEVGIEDTGIKPGVIKVATDREGVTPFVDKALRAAARASKATGLPVTTHTLAAERTAEKQAEVFESEGLDPARVCLGHCDDSSDLEYLTGLARRGYTIGMDHLSWGTRPGVLDWKARADMVRALIDAGFVERIFLSNDWYFGISIAPTGTMETLEGINPDGMLFSTRRIVPYLREQGVSAREIRVMTVDNPRRLLATA